MGVRVHSVSKQFGTTTALHDVSVDIPTGSLTAVLGPSGGGKSTLLRVIAGLEDPDSGRVEIDGTDVTTEPARKRGIGFCFQHHAAFNHMSVAKNIAFGLEVRRRPKAEIARRVRELLDLVHLSEQADRYPNQISGGQRQRMALARALAIDPKVLLLDEPFGSLDTQVRQELRAWLRRLHDVHPVTTLLVTHDQEEAMEVADQLVVVRHGRLEQTGTPAELYDQPATEFVLTFLGPATKLHDRWVRPHDLVLHRQPRANCPTARVERMLHLGFEVRAELNVEGAEPAWAQLSRASAARAGIAEGDRVWVEVLGSAAVQPASMGLVPSSDNESDFDGHDTGPDAETPSVKEVSLAG